MLTHVSDEESHGEETPKSDKSVDFHDSRPSRGESFAKEVLHIDRTKTEPDSPVGDSVSIKFPKSAVELFLRPSHSVTRTHSPTSLQKMISFAQVSFKIT